MMTFPSLLSRTRFGAHDWRLPASVSRLARGTAIVATLVIPLSGCMSSGSSTFSNASLSQDDQTASITRPLPLDVADEGDNSTLQPAPLALQEVQDAEAHDRLQAMTSTQDELPAANSAAATPGAIGGQFASLQPQGQQMRGNLYAPVSGQPERNASLQAAPVLNAPIQNASYQQKVPVRLMDPADQAAETRIPALYASIDHGECKGGFGPKPKMINARRITPGDPYYMEMRLRRTPMLPVGHVYIAYGRLSPDGQPLDEKLIMLAPLGGYGGAAVAAAVPMPGVLKPYGDDCVLNPIAAYRISLTPAKYEKLLLEVERQKEKKPAYALFAYNCNHFMSEVAKSVGVLPPENIYEPSLKYFYSMMDRNEGRKVPRTMAELKQEQLQMASADRVALQ